MRLLFSSSDLCQLERIQKRLIASGVPCELKTARPAGESADLPFYSELWVRQEEDFRVASVLFVEGFVAGRTK